MINLVHKVIVQMPSLYKQLLLLIFLLSFIHVPTIAQSDQEATQTNKSMVDSFLTEMNKEKYIQLGVNFGFCIPVGSYNELTEYRSGGTDGESIYSASIDHFWNNFGIGVEMGSFSHGYHKGPYTTNLVHYDVSWEKEDWTSRYFGIGPTFSLNNGVIQYQMAFKMGIMWTKSPAYESIYHITNPNVLRVKFPRSTLKTNYGSISGKCNFIVSKNINLSLFCSYIGSFGNEYTYSSQESINSLIREKSFEVTPEALSFGVSLSYRLFYR
jgi:hypothetical protein